MSNDALPALLAFAGATAAHTLLVLDENADTLPPCSLPAAQTLSNRIDICTKAKARHWPCLFNDFEFSTLPPCQLALYRISKEKRVVEHVLQSLWSALPAGGALCFAGYRNEGIKTVARRAAEAWNTAAELTRSSGGLHLYRMVRPGNPGTPLTTFDYHALQLIGEWQGMQVFSKPGIFAWDRFDSGSLLLLDHLPTFLGTADQRDTRGLDLGCGNGLLALALLHAGCGTVVATDNNAAALRACAHNLALAGPGHTTHVVPGDCGDGLEGTFDLILCNPPFHQGFAVEQDLTDRFLQATRRLLAPSGKALFVVNAFIPLERKARSLFGSVDTLADDRRYRLVSLRH